MKHGIIIPCYNEGDRLKSTAFSKFISDHQDYELCFVNDGSKDNTLVMLQNLSSTNKRISLIDLTQNQGKAEAVRQGAHYFLDKTTVDTIGFIDADLSTGFEDYKNLTKSLVNNQNCDFVFGSRKLNKSEEVSRSLFRDFASFVIGMLIKLILRLPVKDTQCGAKVFNRSTAQKGFKYPFISRWLFDIEIFLRLKKDLGKRKLIQAMKEIPLKKWEDVDGSKISINDALKFPKVLMQIFNHYELTPTIGRFSDSAYRIMSFQYGTRLTRNI